MGYDLQALHEPGVHRQLWSLLLLKHAIDAIPQTQLVLIGVDVDVAGSLLHGVGEHLIDGGNDRLTRLIRLDLGLRLLGQRRAGRVSVAKTVGPGNQRPDLLAVGKNGVNLALVAIRRIWSVASRFSGSSMANVSTPSTMNRENAQYRSVTFRGTSAVLA